MAKGTKHKGSSKGPKLQGGGKNAIPKGGLKTTGKHEYRSTYK